MQKIISCDWGTSTLRLRVVDVDTATILAEVANAQGISSTFELWKQSERRKEERVSFFHAVLSEQIRKLEEQINASLEDVPVIISGMASSTIGMTELPYKEIPAFTDGHDLYVKTFEASSDFQHKVVLISGVKTADDVMRGEETQLVGCLSKGDKNEDQVLIFPGTHSKHVFIKNGVVVNFKTYMTGEFFELLSKKSILANVVEEDKNSLDERNLQSFEKGVADSSKTNLLHNSFLVRTNVLLDKLSKTENYHYLSGLLIGTELTELMNMDKPVTVVSNQLLNTYYVAALKILGVDKIKEKDAGKAVVNGHCKIYTMLSTNIFTTLT